MNEEVEKVVHFTKVANILHYWNTARNFIKEGKMDKARDSFDTCLIIAAQAGSEGIKELDNISVDLWKTRAWIGLETNNLLLG